MGNDRRLLRLSSLSSGERLDVVADLLAARTLPTTRLAYRRSTREVPAVLARYYEIANGFGRRIGEQNRLLTSDELQLEDGKLLFAAENQYVYTWSTEPLGNDPEVYGRLEPNGVWEPEGNSLSTFLVQFTLFELTMCAPFGASAAWITQRAREKLVAEFESVDAPPWHWPQFPATFYVRDTALLFVSPNVEEMCSVWVGAESEKDIAFLAAHIDEAWEYEQLTGNA